jgi:hypothetical protein
MPRVAHYMSHRANTTSAPHPSGDENSVIVAVKGFNMPITIKNVQNIKAPYTPENIAEITYENVFGFSDVSKVRLNKFKITIDCWTPSDRTDIALAEVRPVEFDDFSKGIVGHVQLSAVFDGTLGSMIHFGHELVHVAQYASKRLRTIVKMNSKDEIVVKSAFSHNGKVVQKGTDAEIYYGDRMWEWEAFAMQENIASGIYRSLVGGVCMELIDYKGPHASFATHCKKMRESLFFVEYDGWESFPVQIQCAYGEAKITASKAPVRFA